MFGPELESYVFWLIKCHQVKATARGRGVVVHASVCGFITLLDGRPRSVPTMQIDPTHIPVDVFAINFYNM